MNYKEIKFNDKDKDLLINKFNKFSANKDAKIFILIYMEGCGPCNQTRPEWNKLQNILSKSVLKNKNIGVISIDKDLFGKLKYIKNEPAGFPTIRYVTNSGKFQENYEDSNISNKNRTIDSFIEWIKLKTGLKKLTNKEIERNPRKSRKSRKSRKHKKTRKILK